MLLNVLIVIVTVIGMEVFACLTHRYIMHGPLGWAWHKSHHEETEGPFEKNDLYAVVFAVISGLVFIFGFVGIWPLRQVGIGLVVYGVLYFIVHDGLVHRRWPFTYVAKSGYLKRLVQAHHMHHAVGSRDGCVSFGFLYAPPIRALKEQLRANAAASQRRKERRGPVKAVRARDRVQRPALKDGADAATGQSG